QSGYATRPRPAQPTYGAQRTQGQQTSSRPAPQQSSRAAGNSQTPQRSSGGGSKILLIILAAVVVIFGSRFLGGGDSGDSGNTLTNTLQTVTNVTQSGGSDLTNLLSSFLSSGNSSTYDFSGGSLLSSITGGSSTSGGYFTSTLEDNTAEPDNTVSALARDKFTTLAGGGKDTITLLVYMCGTDLESQNGMATADIKEMLNADIGKKMNILIYTGGCSRWRNNVISSSCNQIYRIQGGNLTCLESNMGTASMTSPSTLQSFIEYGAKNYPADRMMLIMWDHGGGSVSGYGYDEKYGRNQSMTLAGINTALKNSNVKFDMIGFDACLMATVENGIMLSQYADYMVGSEETEPGVGWYYTNWLTKLGKNTSMSTVEIGKNIADDFVEVCAKQCRGQATTLSVVDLAELEATVPAELKSFSIDTNELIQKKNYKTVSTARSKTREFAQSSRIDQIDLVHFAKNMGTEEGKKLAKAIQGAVKYNRTGGGISNAYGLSIYFPYKRTSNVSKMVSTYQAIGMDEEYTRCIQEFASLEVSGQVSAGTDLSSYGSSSSALPGLMGSLLGSGSSSYSSYGSGDLTSLLGGVFGGSSSGSMADLFFGREMTAQTAAEYISENHFDASQLVWNNGRIEISREQWEMTTGVLMNVFLDDGTGFIDLGMDTRYTTDGNALVYDFDGYWISIDRQPVAYYWLNTVDDGENYVITGYVPAELNGIRVNLILCFDNENPYGYIAGAQMVYGDAVPDTEPKNLIGIGKGDKVQFLCDFYDYDGNYRDSYRLGDPIVLGNEIMIEDTPVSEGNNCLVTWCITDIYQQRYWTPALK
ncbi:MAG: peptidase C11, partial [Clostridiales bacterium]|nr:peptidase C11 [Clostridiales bacterium]